MTWTQARTKIKNSSIGVRKSTKNDENPILDHLVSIPLLPWSSRVVPGCQNGPEDCSRGAKMVSQGAKMETPSPPMATARS